MPPGQPLGERFEEPRDIGIAPDQPAILGLDHRIHRADTPCQRFEPVEQWHDRLLMRHGYIAAAPIGIVAPLGEIGLEPFGRDMFGAVIRIKTKLADPEGVDQRRFRLANGIADDFGIVSHEGRAPSSRNAPRTCSIGIPSTVN